MVKRLLRRNETYLCFVVIAFCATVTAVNPAFFTLQNFFDLLHDSSGSAILAVGFLVILLSGGIDVSFPAVAIMGQYIAVKALIALHVSSLALALAISCGVGLVFGAVNAFFISFFNISTLIVTLGTSGLFYGAMLQVLGSAGVYASVLPNCFKVFGRTNVFQLKTLTGSSYGLSVFALVLAGVVILSWIILRRTLLGRVIYAMGGNMEAVRRSGVNIRAIQFFMYCYMGLLAGVMGVMSGSLIQYSDPTYIVDTELLPVLAGVMLGGASIMGGAGTITGTLLGMALIALLEKNLVLLGIPSYWDQFFVGVVLVVGVSVTHIQRRIRGRRQLSLLRE